MSSDRPGAAYNPTEVVDGAVTVDAVRAAPRRRSQPSLKAEVRRLAERLAAQQADALQHASANLALRVRWHALRLMARASQDVADHRAAVEAARAGASPQRGGGGGGRSGAGDNGGCTEVYCAPHVPSGRGDGSRSSSRSSSNSSSGGGGGGGARRAACVPLATAEALPAWPDQADEDDSLLAGIPHLAPGGCLLELQGASLEEVDAVARMTADEGRAHWRRIAHDAMVATVCEAPNGEPCMPNLKRFQSLLSVWNMPVFLSFTSSNCLTGEPATAGAEAPQAQHAAAIKAAQLTREQGLVTAAIIRLLQERLRPVHAERGELCRQLEALQLRAKRALPGDALGVGSSSNGGSSGGGGGGRGGGGTEQLATDLIAPELQAERPSAFPDELSLFANISANFSVERELLMTCVHACRALWSREQSLRSYLALYPWPHSMPITAMVLESAARLNEPGFFADKAT